MRRLVSIFLAVLLIFIAAGPHSPFGAYLASGAVTTLPEVQPPLVYRPLSLTTPGAPPYTPSEIRKAYNFAPLYLRGIKGNATRIAVIDAFGDPSLSTDLASFDSLTGLPPATLNFFFPDGVPKRPNSNWAVETSLDVEWAHAMAPAATIDLVVALDSSLGHIFDAIAFVASSLPDETILSMSFGLPESMYPSTGSFTIAATHQLFITITSHGTTPFASSGDSGASTCCNPQYPSSDPLVVAVGGTTLTLNPDASYASETAWSGSTAGSSVVFSKPSWQQLLGDSMRDTVDVAYDADLSTGVIVVQGNKLFAVGGTSAGAPQWAALTALASQANSIKYGSIASKLYKIFSYHDITTGSNGFFSATKGWDYPTGLGSPDANATVNSLAVAPDVAIMGIGVSRSFAYAGVSSNPTQVNVTAANLGPLAETFNVSANANSTIIGTQTVTLAAGATATVIFGWNAQLLPKGNYTLSAHASTVPGEVNLANNALTSSTIFTVRLAGDVNNDCVVNFLDLGKVGAAFLTTIGQAGYDPNADLNNDGMINFLDLGIVGANFLTRCAP